jgi:hypothetical protein
MCSACKSSFNSIGSFDEHRSGPQSNRRCLTVAEVEVKQREAAA